DGTIPPQDKTTICGYIKNINPDIVLFNYLNPTESSGASNLPEQVLFRSKCDQEKWFLYDGTGTVFDPNDTVGNAGDVVVPSGGFQAYQINHSDNTNADSAGLNAGDWYARMQHSYADGSDSYGSGDWNTQGFGTRHEYGFDGPYQDIFRYEPRTDGDWDFDGDSDPKTGDIARSAKLSGDHNFMDEMDAIWDGPTLPLQIGNVTQNPGIDTNDLTKFAEAKQYGRENFPRNGGILEGFITGKTSSIEVFAGWDPLMRYYRRSFELYTDFSPVYIILHCSTDVVPATHTDFEWGRYALCTSLMDNGYFGFNPENFTDQIILNEFEIDMGQPVESIRDPAFDPSTDVSGSGYLPYQGGLYKREYYNPATDRYYIALCNPKGNGDQNVTLPTRAGYQWNRLDATSFPDPSQDPSVNDGATNVTSQFLEQRKGIILEGVSV
ncbi:MAG: hypothetical protein R3268_04985, partial [Acidiferrobacterales bacterium]|nr:hypothetical protein [Acidiferrobacterales bacterium]